jgi:hypothetical protein
VLGLTADMVGANSADYTAWQYRWEVLAALQQREGRQLAPEFGFTE